MKLIITALDDNNQKIAAIRGLRTVRKLWTTEPLSLREAKAHIDEVVANGCSVVAEPRSVSVSDRNAIIAALKAYGVRAAWAEPAYAVPASLMQRIEFAIGPGYSELLRDINILIAKGPMTP